MMKIKEGNYVEFWMTESRQPCRFEKEQSQEKEYSRAGMRVACSRSRKGAMMETRMSKGENSIT